MGNSLTLPFSGTSANATAPGFAVSTALGGTAVIGTSGGVNQPGFSSIGVQGISNAVDPLPNTSIVSIGVEGKSTNGDGVHGAGTAGNGVHGESTSGRGVFGTSSSAEGVRGESASSFGVFGTSKGTDGVHGESQSSQHAGVSGINLSGGMGVYAQSSGSDGVQAFTSSNQHAALSGQNSGGGLGLFAGGTPAGRFVGDVEVTGDIRLLNQDCAEDFDIGFEGEVEPGTVMVIDKQGALQVSQDPYDKRVAGVISGAGDMRPGIILGRQESDCKRMPIALLGKVCCKVDAGYSPIEVGDLLTSSPTPGHAMRANDPFKAFGSVIGKALMPHSTGRGIIPVLVALQ